MPDTIYHGYYDHLNNRYDVDYRTADGLAEKWHTGQTDMAGQPYVYHCRQVSIWCRSPEARIIGLLHDIVEDTDCTYYDLVYAGLPPVIVQGVHDMTQREEVPTYREPLETYWERVKRNPFALEVKLADIRHNNDPERQSQLPPERQAKLQAKYARALEWLLA